MRFIVMHKVDASMEAGAPPNPQIIRDMGQLVSGSLKEGVFTNGAGLHRSSMRVRVEYRGGERSITRGPLSGKNEVIARALMVKGRSIEDAIEHAGRLAKVLGDVEIEIGPVVEPWDIGVMPKPEQVIEGRFLLLQKGTADDERGAVRPELDRALAELKKQLTAEGALVMSEELAPTSQGSRLASAPKGKRTWTDGPFAESKELIAGFSILQLPSKKEALAWADRYAAILAGNEVDVLPLK